MNHFHFMRPDWFYALLPLAILAFALLWQRKRSNNWLSVCDPTLIKSLLVQRKGRVTHWPLWLLALMWFVAVFAMAGPSWERQPQAVYRTNQAKVIVLDLSPSMDATDIKPNRATRARYKVLDILRQSKEGQVGMVVFTKEAYTVSPLTQDASTIASMISVLQPNIMPVGGHDISNALTKAASLIHNAGFKNGRIILISDSKATSKALATAHKLATSGITTSVLSLGSKQGAPVETGQGFLKDSNGQIVIAKGHQKSLQALASAGSGNFAQFTDTDTDLKFLLAASPASRLNIHAQKSQQENTQVWQDAGHWFVLLLLPFALLIFRRGWLEEVTQ